VVTRNQFVGPKVVNGAPFKAVDIFPDLSAGRRFEQNHRHEPWFREWDVMPESAQAAEAADEDEDALPWCDLEEISET
jgi:hypothetical protein